jgi:hypothetical protein
MYQPAPKVLEKPLNAVSFYHHAPHRDILLALDRRHGDAIGPQNDVLADTYAPPKIELRAVAPPRGGTVDTMQPATRRMQHWPWYGNDLVNQYPEQPQTRFTRLDDG